MRVRRLARVWTDACTRLSLMLAPNGLFKTELLHWLIAVQSTVLCVFCNLYMTSVYQPGLSLTTLECYLSWAQNVPGIRLCLLLILICFAIADLDLLPAVFAWLDRLLLTRHAWLCTLLIQPAKHFLICRLQPADFASATCHQPAVCQSWVCCIGSLCLLARSRVDSWCLTRKSAGLRVVKTEGFFILMHSMHEHP